MAGSLFVVSGPSGAGKSTLIKKILEKIPNSVFSISTTTRDIRKGEKHGVNYFFTDKESFQHDIDRGYFLEWANVHGNFYGTSLKQITECVKNNKLVILDIDVQGFLSVREKLQDIMTSVFLTTKNQDDLKERLSLRGDKTDDIKLRVKNALSEMKHIDKYEYLVVNDNLSLASDEMLSIAASSRHKSLLVNKTEFILSWSKN